MLDVKNIPQRSSLKDEKNYKYSNRIVIFYNMSLIALLGFFLMSLIFIFILLTADKNSEFLFLDKIPNIQHDKYILVVVFGGTSLVCLMLFIFSKGYLEFLLEKLQISYLEKEILKIDYRLRYKKTFLIYIGLTISVIVFITTWPLSPTNNTNKSTIDKQIIYSLQVKKLDAERILKEKDAVHLLSDYSDNQREGAYEYSITVDPLFYENSKYISSNFERVYYDSLNSEENIENALKIRDYKYGKGVTDNKTYWKYRSDKLSSGVKFYGSMTAVIPPLTCMRMNLLVSGYTRDYEINQEGSAGINVAPSKKNFEGDIICNDKTTATSHDLNIESIIDGNKNIMTEMSISYFRRSNGQFSEIPSPFQDESQKNAPDKSLVPSFSKINVFLDKQNATSKEVPNFCIEGKNLGYKSNIWSIKSDSINPSNQGCG